MVTVEGVAAGMVVQRRTDLCYCGPVAGLGFAHYNRHARARFFPIQLFWSEGRIKH